PLRRFDEHSAPGRARGRPPGVEPARRPRASPPQARHLPGLGPPPASAADPVPRNLRLLPRGRAQRRAATAQLRVQGGFGGPRRTRHREGAGPLSRPRPRLRSPHRGVRHHADEPEPRRTEEPRSHRPCELTLERPPYARDHDTKENPLMTTTDPYTAIPLGALLDTATSDLPEGTGTRSWVLSKPVAGGAVTFSQTILEVAPGGGSEAPEPQPEVEGFLFVMAGQLDITHEGRNH